MARTVRGIEASAQKDADGNVAHHLLAHGLFELVPEPFHVVPPADRRMALAFSQAEVPVRRHLEALRGVREGVRGRKFPDPAKDGPRRRNVLERKVLVQRDDIDAPLDPRMLEDGFQLGAEDQLIARESVVERLDAEAIPGEKQLSRLRVPDGEREHSVEVAHRVRAELLVGVDHHLGVRPGLESMAELREKVAQALVVVDFAIEDDPERPVFVRDRLMASLDVDDGEPPRGEPGPGVEEGSFIVRTAVGDRSRHRFENGPVGFLGGNRIEDAADATH